MSEFDKYEKEIAAKIAEMEFNGSSKIASELVNYMKGILEWNEKINLTAIKNPGEFVIKHFFDSFPAAILPEFRNAETIIDVGTGGGFPGVPLAALCPGKNFVLADSLAKRLRVIDAVAIESGITNITTVHGRAEDFARPGRLRESFDICVSRAVANLSTLSEYCIPFVKKGGCFVSYKGSDMEEEAASAKAAIRILGGDEPEIFSFYLPDSDIRRNLYLVRKKAPTPGRYPRKAGLPGKEPIHG